MCRWPLRTPTPLKSSCVAKYRPGRYSLYKLYRYVPPQRVGFLSRFGLKTGIDFAPVMDWNRVWFSREFDQKSLSGVPNENIVQNHLNQEPILRKHSFVKRSI